MPKRYPPLNTREIIKILKALGFTLDRTRGDHEYYEMRHSNKRWSVTVDTGCDTFDHFLIKSMIKQSGFKRKAFDGATTQTAKKI